MKFRVIVISEFGSRRAANSQAFILVNRKGFNYVNAL